MCKVPTTRFELAHPKETTPSRWRVYQFHHVGIMILKGNTVDKLKKPKKSIANLGSFTLKN